MRSEAEYLGQLGAWRSADAGGIVAKPKLGDFIFIDLYSRIL
ncbi:hypothetical protein [Lewinella sp. LCG006]